MKIGIVSMQRIHNYGSFLQAYGLKNTIQKLGYEVTFIDYKVEPCIVESRYGKSKWTYRYKCMRKKLNKFLVQHHIRKIHNIVRMRDCEYHFRFEDEFYQMLGLSKKKQYRTKVDTVVIGSDEVFNCLQDNEDVGFSRELFGVNQNAGRIITYAASCGNTTLERLKKYHVTKQVAEWLKSVDVLSVRDVNTEKVIGHLTEKEIQTHLDPVLISDFSDKVPKEVDLKDYIIVYAYPGRISEEEAKQIQLYAKRKQKKLLCLGYDLEFCDEYRNCTPFEVLAYFKHAYSIITDTFHGSIFSIINNKPFATLVRPTKNESYGNEEKLTDLLNRLQLADRICYNIEDVLVKVESPIPYERVNKLLDSERKRSLEYLKKNLKS